MSSQGGNRALRVLLDEAGVSNAGLGRAVVAAGAREGIHLATGTTSVRRMLDGCQPRWPVPRLVTAVLSQRLHREVSVAECGFADRTPAADNRYDGPELRGHTVGHDLKQAAALGRDALRTAAEVSSTLALDGLRTLQRQAAPLRSASPHLADLDERITAFLTRATRRQQQDDNNP
jgi:hypothetical protein